MDGNEPIAAPSPFASAADRNVMPPEYQAATIGLAQTIEHFIRQLVPAEERERIDVGHSAGDRKSNARAAPGDRWQ
jgi:hypothetical protein